MALRSAAVLALFLVCTLCGAEDLSVLQGEFWLDREPATNGLPATSITGDAVTQGLLKEAQTTFSAMIYGYDFTWVPEDTVNKRAESITLTSSGAIPWGDLGLQFLQSKSDENTSYIRVRYLTKDFEQARMDAWFSSAISATSGTGSASYSLGLQGKDEAFKKACIQAIKVYARSQTRNRPTFVSGSFIVAKLPRVYVKSGQYVYEVSLKVKISRLDEALVF